MPVRTSRHFREDFDREREFSCNKQFTAGGKNHAPGQPVDKKQFSLRRLRQLYDQRYIGFAPVRLPEPVSLTLPPPVVIERPPTVEDIVADMEMNAPQRDEEATVIRGTRRKPLARRRSA